MDTQEGNLSGRRRRRRHSAEFKAAVIQECMQPGISVAAVALAHKLNANMLRKWVIEAEHRAGPAQPPRVVQQAGGPAPAFVPLAVSAPPAEAADEIHIELHRAGTTVKIAWPTGAAHHCAAWLRDWLR
jgi:transposase-like protein